MNGISGTNLSDQRRLRLVILSPFMVLLFGQVAIRFFSSVWGSWGWLPFWLAYTLILGFFIHLQA